MRDTLSRYLDRYAEPDRGLAEQLRSYEHVLVVPCYDEGRGLDPLIRSVPPADALVVVVVNADAQAQESVRDANNHSVKLVRSRGSARELGGGTWVQGADTDWLVLVRDVPRRRGVGLARKIGGDLVARMGGMGKVRSGWLRMTDADAVLPKDYWEQTPPPGAVAHLHGFEHAEVLGHEAHIRAYESHLHAYVAGLARAGSRYAFHSIGSTISVRLDAYAAVRGVPRRAAAEDFYLLDKLAKLGVVHQATGAPIVLSGRPSHRVPFGTGVAVKKPLAELERTYDPRSFLVLAAWLRVMGGDDPACGLAEALREALPGSARESHGAIAEILERLGAFEAVRRAARQTRSRAAYRRSVHTFFDGFKTMKLIRELRVCFPDVPLVSVFGAADLDDVLARARQADMKRRRLSPSVGLGA